jgi:phosphoserine phosphatase
MTPLAVDLDGTLIKTDLLIESALRMTRRQPYLVPLMFIWLLWGRAYLKHQIARRVDLDVSRLPYRKVLVEFLHEQHAGGRTLVLATASHRKYAQQVADHLGIFHHVLATDRHINLKASTKARALRELIGHGSFDYVGDSRADLAVWAECTGALLVDPSPRLLGQVRRVTEVKHVFPADS